MKKIMKKVMSLALVVMMLMSLVPMTVFAEDGVTSVVTSQTFVETAESHVENTEVSGSWSGEWTEVTVTIEDKTSHWTLYFMEGHNGASYSSRGGAEDTQTYLLAPYSDLVVQIMADGEGSSVTYSITTQVVDAPAEGSELNPYYVNYDYELTLEGGSVSYFKTVPGENGAYRVVITGAETDEFVLAVQDKRTQMVQYIPAENGVIKTDIFEIETEYNPSYSYQIITEGTEDVTLYFSVLEVYGTYSCPDTPVMGENSATLDAAYRGQYNYTWIAPEAGTITVTMDVENNEDGWQYGFGYYMSYTSEDAEISATKEMEVVAGDEIRIMVAPMAEEGTVNWSFNFEAADGVADSKAHMGTDLDETYVETTDWTRVTVTIETGENWVVCLGSTTFRSDEVEVEEGKLPSVSIDAAADQTVYVGVMATDDYDVITYKITTQKIDAPATGTELNPMKVESSTQVTIPAGTQMYFSSVPTNGGSYVLDVVGSNTTDVYKLLYTEWGYPVEVESKDGKASCGFKVNPAYDSPSYEYSIVNTSDKAVTVTITNTVKIGTIDNPDKAVVGSNTVDLGLNEEYVFAWTAPEAGKVTVTMNTATNWMYSFANVSSSVSCDTHWSDDDPVVKTETLDVKEGQTVKMSVAWYMADDSGVIEWTLGFVNADGKEYKPGDDLNQNNKPGSGVTQPDYEGEGTEEEPYIATSLGKYVAVTEFDSDYFTWTAKENGVLNLLISEEDAAAGKKVYVRKLNGEEIEWVSSIELKKGDVVLIAAYASNESLEFNMEFKAGETLAKPTEKPLTNANDKQKYDEIVTGTAKLDTTVVTTLFTVTPDKVGKYTITAPTGVKVEDWNVPSNPMNRTEKVTNTVTFNCTAVGQTFLVGITAAESVDKVDVKVEFTAVAQKEEVAWTIYKNTATISKFETVLSGLEYVDVEDKVVDKAVLGKDGFYHLNAANGPILYVDLDDSLMSLYGAADLGKVVEYITADGEVVAKISYNEAVLEYYKAANKDGLYPLTTDLVTIFQKAGAYLGWYGEDGFIGFKEADAWMFACYYVPGTEDEEADNTVVAPIPVPEEGKDVVVDKEYLDEYIEQAVQSGAPLELPTTNENVTMTFDPSDLADADKIELNLTVNVVADAKDETVAKNDKITEDNFVLKVEFSHEGKLPGEAVISIQLPAAIAEKYEKLFYYQIMADGSLKFVCDAPVVDGVAKVTQDHCSDYVLLTEKVVDVPATGDSTNVAIWFAVLALGALAIAGSVVMRKKEF